MKLDQLEAFVAVAEERHFGRAAARLIIGTSSLSKRLAELERSIGLRLFERSSREVVLTPAANLLLDQARRTLSEAAGFATLAAEAAAGEIGRVSLVHAMNHFDFLKDLVASLAVRRPDIELSFHERPPGRVADAVIGGEASVGLCWKPIPPGLDSYCFDVLPLDTIFVPPEHRLAGRESVELQELEGETFMSGPGNDPASWWRALGVTVLPRRVDISGRDEIATRVEMGDCLALTSSRAVKRYRHRNVVAVPLRDRSTWSWLEQLVVWRSDNPSPIVQEVVLAARDIVGHGWPHPAEPPDQRGSDPRSTRGTGTGTAASSSLV